MNATDTLNQLEDSAHKGFDKKTNKAKQTHGKLGGIKISYIPSDVTDYALPHSDRLTQQGSSLISNSGW